MASVLTALGAMGLLSLVLATLLVIAGKRLRVVEDPRIDLVEEMLPHVNCGACGYPGCRPFAQALVKGQAPPVQCTVGSPEDHAKIAGFLGVEVGAQQRRVARLACAGADNVAHRRAHYSGLESCGAAALVGGGDKACLWGCLGLGACVDVCDFDALHMGPGRLPAVDEDLCTACGDCVTACPKDLFSLVPVEARIFVRCKSELAGEAALEHCDVACDACGRCAMDAPDLITMHRHLPLVSITRPHRSKDPILRCPTGAIVWCDAERGPVLGPAARKVVRKEPRPVIPT